MNHIIMTDILNCILGYFIIGTEIDNQCLSAFEDGCDYLTERGYLQTLNGRIYTLTKK